MGWLPFSRLPSLPSSTSPDSFPNVNASNLHSPSAYGTWCPKSLAGHGSLSEGTPCSPPPFLTPPPTLQHPSCGQAPAFPQMGHEVSCHSPTPSPWDFLPSRIFFPVLLLLKKVSMTVIPSPFWISNPCSLLITTTLPTRSFKYTHVHTHTVSMTFAHLPFHFSRGLQTGLHLIFTVAKLSGC